MVLRTIIATLRLDRGIILDRLENGPGLYKFFRSFDAVQVLELDGTAANCVQNVLSIIGIFPGLKVIRVTVGWHGCKRTLQLLPVASRQRRMEGNPLTYCEGVTFSRRRGWVGP